ncbi:hypothetical protein LRR18_16160 [Mangrovimonas sp. AS39]|nr:hypothetical protein [Mangrovimonas futianensis]MCF1193123.1 hypothetical protein [Mangrovimonas futianensis]
MTIFMTTYSNLFGQESQIDSTILRVESETIDDMLYTATIRTDYTLCLTDSIGKIVFKIENSYPNIEFIDFDNDGNKDLMISYISNVPGIQDFVKYDSKGKSFKLIENFPKYPDSKPIKGTKYFYSYHRSGCADMNWDSDLFYIEDFKTIKIGNISGRECNNEGIDDGIYIYKIRVDNKDLIETLPIDTINKFQDYKWGFIADYWTKKYNEFK